MIKKTRTYILLLLFCIIILFGKEFIINYQLRNNSELTNGVIIEKIIIYNNENQGYSFGGTSTVISIMIRYNFMNKNKKYTGSYFIEDPMEYKYRLRRIALSKEGDSIIVKYSKLFPSINTIGY